jgi:hypothetical protein
MDKIYYRSGYKYQLVKDYSCQVNIFPDHDINLEFISLSKDGKLSFRSGYAWDGPSGCAIDTNDFMRPSLIHDGLYQLIRARELPASARKQADIELKKACIEDGMPDIRVHYVYKAVRIGAGPSADPKNDRKILTAP